MAIYMVHELIKAVFSKLKEIFSENKGPYSMKKNIPSMMKAFMHMASMMRPLSTTITPSDQIPTSECSGVVKRRRHTPLQAGGACKAPHKNGTRSSDLSLSWIRMPFIPSAASCGVLRLKPS